MALSLVFEGRTTDEDAHDLSIALGDLLMSMSIFEQNAGGIGHNVVFPYSLTQRSR